MARTTRHDLHGIQRNWVIPVVVALLVAAIGSYLLVRSHATTPTAVTEVETGSVTSAASVSDATASGGRAIKYTNGTNTTAPSVPTGLTGSAVSTTQINLSWNPSTDTGGSGLVGYRVYRGGTQITSNLVTTTSFGDSGLTANTTYSYTVKAFDNAGAASAASNAVSVTTTPVIPPPPPGNSPCGKTTTHPATYKHVIWLWEENKSYPDVVGNSGAPYLSQLVSQCATATNWTSLVHPSSGNYIGGTAGQIPPKLNGDPLPTTTTSTTIDNLFRQVRTTGGKAISYQEDMPSNCDITDSADLKYRPKHNPAVYYWDPSDKAACQTDNISMGTTTSGNFINALATDNSLPTFSFITPNACNDMHDCTVTVGDTWLQKWLPVIFGSPAYQSGDTAIFIMWDESNTSSSSSVQPGVFIAPSIPAGTVISSNITHYNVLRTTEEMLGIKSYLGAASSATSLRTNLNL